MSERKGFDDLAREGLILLLENFWILRDQDPEAYQLIRDRENVLKDYVLDKLGYHLILHRYFVKLEKIPAVPEAWMGIESFQHPRDYALLCTIMAFLESKGADEQFLLSDLCTEVQAIYPGELALNWLQYEHRKSLVRVMAFLEKMGMLRIVDGDTLAFNQNEEAEVLYEVSVVARYFLRSYPKDLLQFHTKEELLDSEIMEGEDELSGARRRYRVYRQLLLSPAIYREETEEGDFLYLRNFRARLYEDLEKHAGYQLELYRHAALLVAPEPKARLTLFPDQKGISDIVLQFSAYWREEYARQQRMLDNEGNMALTPVEFEQGVKICKERYGAGWSKQYREALLKQIARELLESLLSWKMAKVDTETNLILLRPGLARLVGEYPADFHLARTGEKTEAKDKEGLRDLNVPEEETI